MNSIVQSVLARLARHANRLGLNPNHVLTRFGMERLLYRLSRSPHSEQFVLKGGLLLLVWLGETIRPTRDADLLGFGELDDAALRRTFAELCALPVEPDGVIFDPTSIRVEPIRIEDPYGGRRVLLRAHLSSARIRIQVDVGVGDAVVPEPEWIDYPALLDFPRPHLRTYRRETAIAEKLHAMVVLGAKNSRMRDFFDIQALASHESFDGAQLLKAIIATFDRRGTTLTQELPLALTSSFATIPGKTLQWEGFVRRLSRSSASPELSAVIADVAAFAGPVLLAAGRNERSRPMSWCTSRESWLGWTRAQLTTAESRAG